MRLMLQGDLDAVLRVQAQCYPPEMNEPRAVLAQRLQACPDTAWVALDAQEQVAAYLVAYRSVQGRVTPLGHPFADDAQANVLYLHDLAIGQALRGQGVAHGLIQVARAWATSQGYQGLALVSVNDTVAFWQGHGLEITTLDAAGQTALATYPGRAVYMTSTFSQRGQLEAAHGAPGPCRHPGWT